MRRTNRVKPIDIQAFMHLVDRLCVSNRRPVAEHPLAEEAVFASAAQTPKHDGLLAAATAAVPLFSGTF